MQMNRKAFYVSIVSIFFILIPALLTPAVSGDPSNLPGENPASTPGNQPINIIIPGDVSRICYYTDYFYNFPSEDFLYYLNDRMLFWEKPDGLIIENGVRHRLLEVLMWHRNIRDFLQVNSQEKKDRITFNLKDKTGYAKAIELFTLLGRQLEKNNKGQYYITLNPQVSHADYFRFSLVRPHVLEQQLNQTHTFHFQLKEEEVPIPWDLAFLGKITGLQLDKDNFFEYLLKDEQFSLLIAILYRLSDQEIQYIDQLDGWKQIYQDRKLLMGMFVLSHALRVKEGKLLLPGGEPATDFWVQMAKSEDNSPQVSSFDFIRQLAVKDNGKLNYLYVFAYYLQDDVRSQVLCQYQASQFQNIYRLVPLGEKEILTDTIYPVLDDWNFFVLLYILQPKEGTILFPQGVDTWLAAIKDKNATNAADSNPGASVTSTDFFIELLKHPANGTQMSANQKFMAIYSKFYDRPELLADGALAALYQEYENYNGVVDYIEKIPVKNPGTVIKFLEWARKLSSIGREQRILYTTICQGLLETLSFAAHYAPHAYDYDLVLSQLLDIPLTPGNFYTGVMQFLKKNLGVVEGQKNLIDVMLTGVPNQSVMISGAEYLFAIQESFKNNVNLVMEGQGIVSLEKLLAIDRLLETGLTIPAPNSARICEEINDSFMQLPYPGISNEAPREIRLRVLAYSRPKMMKLVKELTDGIRLGKNKEQLQNLVKTLREEYLVYKLREHLLGLAYAASAKNPKLKSFNNPNYVRLHDINSISGGTSWDSFGKIKKNQMLDKYHLSGGLARLNMEFTASWKDHLFRENVIHNPPHVQGMLLNLLEFYPLPCADSSVTYHGLLVELGLDILREARENTAAKKDILDAIKQLISGYHYYRVCDYINGKSEYNNLFFSEIKQLGEYIWLYYPDRPYLANLESFKRLQSFKSPENITILENEKDRFGSSFPLTFGNLKTRELHLFPQDVGSLLGSNCLSGAMIDEYKIKLAYHMYKKQIPAPLMGQLLYMYLDNTGKQFLRQGHIKDFAITYFVFDIFNTSHLNSLIKKLQKEGHLQLK